MSFPLEVCIHKAKEYVEYDINPHSKAIIQKYLDDNDNPAIEKLFGTRISFGTAGLRAEMGPGYATINDLIILQTCQGLVSYMLQNCGLEAKDKGIIVGYDHRRHESFSSRQFARICSAVFLEHGFRVNMLEHEHGVATPLVAFGVLHMKAAAGFMVTASHNPFKDNGFKMYWNNGAQIIPPHDEGIATYILSNLKPAHNYNINSVMNHSLAKDVTAEVTSAYFDHISRLSFYKNVESKLKVAYTPMHGIGWHWVQKALIGFGHTSHLLPVPSQMMPDALFPTVAFPNPEEKGALNEAMKFAELNECTIIIANDPDADRLALAEFIKNENKWHVFTGNEIGALLGHWLITNYKNTAATGSQAAVLASVVSSRFLKKIALQEGINYYDTLTGFKWLANRSVDLRRIGVNVLFSYEEALGYCVGDLVNDKDGLSAACVVLEMANQLMLNNTTIYQHFKSLQQKYGVFVSYNGYVISHDKNVTNAIFHNLRKSENSGYISAVGGIKVKSIKDITLGYDSTAAPDFKCDMPLTPDSHMIMFEFENNVNVTLRTSGTEPKIKYYTEIAGNNGESEEQLNYLIHEFVDQFVKDFIHPLLNGH